MKQWESQWTGLLAWLPHATFLPANTFTCHLSVFSSHFPAVARPGIQPQDKRFSTGLPPNTNQTKNNMITTTDKHMKTIHCIHHLACLALLASCTAWPTLARADLLNGSFENTASTWINSGAGYMSLPLGSTTIPGWTVVSDELAWFKINNWANITPADGNFFLDLTGDNDTVPHGGMTQTIVTVPLQSYTLSLSLGANLDNPNYAGQKSVLVSAGSSSATFTFTPTATSGNQWGNYSFNFVATSASTAITITGTDAGTGRAHLGLDNIKVVPEVVPEPSTALLLGIGILLFARKRLPLIKCSW
jgi:hypothetical protein